MELKQFHRPERLGSLGIEAALVFLVAALCLYSTRPLLEEWPAIAAFRSSGWSYFITIFPFQSARPLHLFPSALYWFIGRGTPVGVAVIGLILILGRYAAARWAVAGFLPARAGILFSTFAAIMPGWRGVWLGRFHSAQLSSIYVIFAFGLSLRLMRRGSLGLSLLLSVFGFLSLINYQAFIVVLVAFPTLPFLLDLPKDGNAYALGLRLKAALRIAVPIIACLGAYALYLYFVTSTFEGSYESTLVTSLSIDMLSAMLFQNYLSNFGTFFLSPYSPASILLLLIAFGLRGLDKGFTLNVAMLVLLILLLPATGLVFLYPLHVADHERVMMSMVFGALIVLYIAVANWRRTLSLPVLALICLAFIVFGWRAAYDTRQFWNLQERLIEAVTQTVPAGTAEILVRDRTGRYGDVYTFYGSALQTAMGVLGRPMVASICTPSDVMRYHPDAVRYPLSSTPTCEAQAQSSSDGGPLVFDFDGYHLTLVR